MDRLVGDRTIPDTSGLGAGTVGRVGRNLHPTRQERPPAYDRNVPAAVGESANTSVERTDHSRTITTNPRNETMYKATTLITLIALSYACSPLRQMQTSTQEQTEISDTTLTELIRREIEHRFGTLRQTVVEFYPPAEIPPPPDPADLPDTLKAVLPPPKIPVRRSVKRITYTEASVQNDKAMLTDSISRSRINTAARSDTQTVTEEKPSNTVSGLKWAALLAGALLLILLFLKLR
nr:MAG TPA: hypothetical protein [Caudoviricetes sp.]